MERLKQNEIISHFSAKYGRSLYSTTNAVSVIYSKSLLGNYILG